MAVEHKDSHPSWEALQLAGMPPATRTRFVPTLEPQALPKATLSTRAPLCLALIATRNYLPFAQVLARSFRAHHQSVPIFLLVTDGRAEDRGLFSEVEMFF